MSFISIPAEGLNLESNDLSSVTGVLAIVNGGTASSTSLGNGRIMASSGGAIVESTATTAHLLSSPYWTKYTLTHTDFQTAALTNSIELFSLAAKTLIHKVIIKHTTAFASTTTYSLSVGITGTLAKYIAAFDVKQAVSSSTFGASLATVNATLEDFSSATSIKITAVSTIDNLSTSTAGVADIYVQTSLLP